MYLNGYICILQILFFLIKNYQYSFDLFNIYINFVMEYPNTEEVLNMSITYLQFEKQ